MYAAKKIRARGFTGTVAALVTFDDQIEKLKASGVDLVFSAYKEAGTGFADHVCAQMKGLPLTKISNTVAT